jgi:hypothetical protein
MKLVLLPLLVMLVLMLMMLALTLILLHKPFDACASATVDDGTADANMPNVACHLVFPYVELLLLLLPPSLGLGCKKVSCCLWPLHVSCC